MPRTKNFDDTVKERLQGDPEFRRALLQEAMQCFLEGDVDTGRGILRDYIEVTLTFPRLGKGLKKTPESLRRMLAPSGNPSASELFRLVAYLQKKEGVRFSVQEKDEE